MNLAIVGYGKMGRLIEQLAPEYGFDVKLRLDMDNNAKFEGLTKENFRGIDAAMEFSTPATATGKYRAAGAPGREHRDRDDGLVRRNGARASGRRARRDGAGLESQLFGGGQRVQSDCCRGGAAVRAPAGIWRVGMGNSSRDEKGRAFGHAARAGRRDETRAATTKPIDTSSSRAGAHPGTHEIGFRFRRRYDYDPPHGAQPRGICARSAARGAMGGGKKGFFDFREIVNELE